MGMSPISEQVSSAIQKMSRFSVIALCLLAIPAHAKTWAELEGHLAVLSKTIETNETEIKELIERKHHTNDLKEIGEIVKEMAAHQKELEKAGKEYEAERQQARFEHPEKNDHLDRVYVRHEVKSLEEAEKGDDKSLDGRLDHIRARVFATYPPPERVRPASNPKFEMRKPASAATDEDAEEKIHLVK